ncbi:hypothetical protein H8959_021571 [Pygathrix nigripes]
MPEACDKAGVQGKKYHDFSFFNLWIPSQNWQNPLEARSHENAGHGALRGKTTRPGVPRAQRRKAGHFRSTQRLCCRVSTCHRRRRCCGKGRS